MELKAGRQQTTEASRRNFISLFRHDFKADAYHKVIIYCMVSYYRLFNELKVSCNKFDVFVCVCISHQVFAKSLLLTICLRVCEREWDNAEY